ncbi:hypothetical protein LR013_04080 [candidate division NPL-UPA2 bacterium]|nr:hypothetical protein [candidate division NPL-UPA2 bacterium]
MNALREARYIDATRNQDKKEDKVVSGNNDIQQLLVGLELIFIGHYNESVPDLLKYGGLSQASSETVYYATTIRKIQAKSRLIFATVSIKKLRNFPSPLPLPLGERIKVRGVYSFLCFKKNFIYF